MKYFITSLITVFAAITSLSAQPKVGEMAFEIALPDTKGNVIKLSDYKGKIVLVDFWASWCGPCRKANPELGKLYSKYKEKGFEIYGVSIDDEKKAWRKAIEADGIKWKQVNERGGWEAPVALQWKLEQIPASFLLDREGKVVALDPTRDELETHLANLLK